MKKLSRAEFLAANDKGLQEYTIKTEGYGGVVYLKTMSAKEQLDIEKSSRNKNEDNLATKLIVMCVCDEQGNPLFTEADIDAINNKSASVVLELYEAIIHINMKDDRDIEDLAKNS
jgi:hypothetical protein